MFDVREKAVAKNLESAMQSDKKRDENPRPPHIGEHGLKRSS
jgi:hypothetical protein